MPNISKISDNIVTISGKFKYEQDQFFNLGDDTYGVVISANENEAQLLVIGDPSKIKIKTSVSITKNKLESIESYAEYFGSIITPLGDIIHPIKKEKKKKIGESSLDNNSPALLDREGLNEGLRTGILAIDTMIPIGKGQRELIIGDRSTGKTSIALSTVINQKKSNVKTVYVAVGQKRNSIISNYNLLKSHNVLDNVIIIFSNPDSAAQQFFAPRVGMAMAESIAYKGEDVLLIIDDLTKHANIYREISLSIGKNPGREAYPTDIFYRHSKLLERAGKFNKKYNNGSITCLPIIETIQGDIASLIPSNAISITDGQIFTSADMFNNGMFPAINIGLSVSRTGSTVQDLSLKESSKGLKAQYSALFDVKKFADMSIDISEELQKKLEDWEAINNILLQFGYKGYSKEHILILTELFRMKALSKIKDRRGFSLAFKNMCDKSKGAKIIINRIKKGLYKQGQEEFQEALSAVFVPLVKISSGIETDIISNNEYKILKEEK